jgi:hypothetical protein
VGPEGSRDRPARCPPAAPQRTSLNQTPPGEWPPRARFSETISWMPSQRIWSAARQRRAAGPSPVRGALVLGDGASEVRDGGRPAGADPHPSSTRNPSSNCHKLRPTPPAWSSAAAPGSGTHGATDTQGHVMMPARPGAALEVVQAGRALELVIVLLDPPSQLAQAGQFNHWRGPGEVRQPVLDRLGLVGQATRPAASARAAPTPVAGDWPGRVELRP